MGTRRYPLQLDTSYPPERQVFEVVMSVPDGERAAFLRSLVLIGHQEIQKERQRSAKPQQPVAGDGGNDAQTP